MYLALIAVAAGAVVAAAPGGRLAHLARNPLRAVWLLAAGAGCELVAGVWPRQALGLGLVIAGYVLMIGWAAINARLLGMVLVGVGLLSNLLVIAVDGGMPVRAQPPGVALGVRHHGEGPTDHLTALADNVRLAPLGQTVSAGDIVLSAGAAVVTFALLRPVRRREPAPSR